MRGFDDGVPYESPPANTYRDMAGSVSSALPSSQVIVQYIQNFTDIDFSDGNGDGSLVEEYDTSNYLSADSSNQRSKKLSITAGKGQFFAKSPLQTSVGSIDGKIMHLRFYIHDEVFGYANPKLQLQMRSYDDASYSDYRVWNLWEKSEAGDDKLSAGWNEITISVDQPQVRGDTFDPTEDKYQFFVKFTTIGENSVEGSEPAVTMDRFMIYSPFSSPTAITTLPMFMLTFDDGQATVAGTSVGAFDIAALLSGQGFVGSFFIVPSYVGDTGFLTVEDLRKMKFAGHLIGNHSYSHLLSEGSAFEDLTEEGQYREIYKAIEWMKDNGLGQGAHYVALPGNAGRQWPFEKSWGHLVHFWRGGYPNGGHAVASDGANVPIWNWSYRKNFVHVSCSDGSAAGGMDPQFENIVADGSGSWPTGAVLVYNGHNYSPGGGGGYEDLETLLSTLRTNVDSENCVVGTPADLQYRLA